MEKDEIIRKVMAEVERRLQSPAHPRRLALVEAGPGLTAVLGRLLQLGDVAAVLCGRAGAAVNAGAWGQLLPTLPDEIDRLEQEVLPHLELLLLPNLRPGTAARIALGMDHGTVPYLAQAALWAGVKVAATPGWAGGGPPAYRKLYDGYLQRLREFGVEVATTSGEAPGEPVAAGMDPPVFEGKVLTANDVFTLLKQGTREVTLPATAIVTALAADTARGRGLRLIRR
jgi:hypothetical protein